MAKPKSAAAQMRSASKKGADLRDREGVANIGAAAVATRTEAEFVDYDFALGYVSLAAKMSSVKRKACIDIGRGIRLGLVPTTTADVGVDLVVRLPADHPDATVVATKLLTLGLKLNRKRVGALYLECVGVSDEASVRAVVEPVGGRVNVIVSPTVASGETSDSARKDEVATGEADATVEDDGAPGEAEQEAPEKTRAADDAAPPAAEEARTILTVASEAKVGEEAAPHEGEAKEGAVEETREMDGAAPVTADEADVIVPVASEAAGGEIDELPLKEAADASDPASAPKGKDDPAAASTVMGLLGVPVNPAPSWPMRPAASGGRYPGMRPPPKVRPLGDLHPGRDTSDGERASQENLA